MKKNTTFLLIVFLLTCLSAWSQSESPAMQAYDKAQDARSQARDLWGKDHPTKADLDQGIIILNNALHYLDSIPIKELAQTNIYLKGRKHDVYFDLISAYTLNHQYNNALSALESMSNEGSFAFISMLKKDSVYSPIRKDERFTAIVNKLENRAALWNGTAFKTPLKPDLSETEKIAGLTVLWAQAKYNFVYFDHLDIDWNQLYLDYLPKVKATKSTYEYYKLLQTFYAQLKDGHSNVYLPADLNKAFNVRPPIKTEMIEGKVFITDVYSDSLKNEGIMPGLEIVQIDNTPVIDYAEKWVKPYQSSSTPQDLQIREFSYALLAGAADKPVVLTLKNRSGKIETKSIARAGYHDLKYTQSMTYENIKGIGYLVINSFEDRKIIKQFDSLYTNIATTKGLIIDVRNNGGGDSDIGDKILASLTDKPFKTEAIKILKFSSLSGAGGGSWEATGPGLIQPNGKHFYDKPVVLLVSARTFSAAEDFTVEFGYMKRGKMIGQATGGSTGQPVSFDLPGGGKARVCGKVCIYPDGEEFVGVGIVPDIVVTKTIKDLQKGVDAEKNKALELLNK